MSAYHEISIPVPGGDMPAGTTVLLVNDFNNITRRADLRPDIIVAFEADWSYFRTSHRDEQSVHRLILHTKFGTSYIVDVKPRNDAGEHFANILDDLSSLIGAPHGASDPR